MLSIALKWNDMELNITFLNIGLAFIEGMLLIISPCILPVLPLILAGSVVGGDKRPFGVIVGFVLSFAIFTLFARQIVLAVGLDLNIIRYLSFTLLMIFGLVMLSSYLTEKFTDWTQGIANLGTKLSNRSNNNGFLSGVGFGTLVGLIWTPCAGPILAAVIVQSILQSSTLSSFFTVLSFGIGAAIPMLLIIFLGRTLKNKLQILQKHTALLRKILGLIIILTVLAMLLGTGQFFNRIKNTDMVTTSGMELKDGLLHPFRAPPLEDISAWINSPPLKLSELHGKVVLIDFWAYSCINCIRTLPYLKDWYAKYHKDGFEIIGVHSPEFDFEADLNNVEAAVEAQGILYPVALDNHFATWKNYNNLYWPAHYLINKDGMVVYEHFGEGKYEITENNIRFLLGLNQPMITKDNLTPLVITTPETYLGYSRIAKFQSGIISRNKIENYKYPDELAINFWALNGKWNIQAQKIVSAAPNAAIKINFQAKKVFAVMQASEDISVIVKLNDKSIDQQKDTDIQNGIISIKEARLYKIINLTNELDGGLLELIATKPGLEVYTFTFGG